MPSTVRPASPMWQGATFQTRLPILADQARLGLFSIGDIALLGGGILIVAICLRQTLNGPGRRFARRRTTRAPSSFRILVTRMVAYETDGCCKEAWLLKKCVIGMSFWLRSSLPSSFSSHLN